MYNYEDPAFLSDDDELLDDEEEIESEDLGCQCMYCTDHDFDDMDLGDDVYFLMDRDDDGRDGIAAD